MTANYTILQIQGRCGKDGKKAETVLDVDVDEPPRKAMAVDVEQAGSPQRKSEGLTFEDIKALFAGEAQEMLRAQREDISRAVQTAVARSEKSTLGALDDIKRSLMQETESTRKQLEGVAQQQQTMQADHKDLMARVAKLECKPMSLGPAASTDGEKRPALVFGGWPPRSRRQIVLRELDVVLKDLAADEYLDERPWAPGPRRGVALVSFRLRQQEQHDDMKDRMLIVADLINKAGVPTPSTLDGCPLWCTVARDRNLRVESGHASKLRRLLHVTKVGVDNIDTDYKEGSVYKDDVLVGSVLVPAPAGIKTLPGKVAGSWFAPGRVCQGYWGQGRCRGQGLAAGHRELRTWLRLQLVHRPIKISERRTASKI